MNDGKTIFRRAAAIILTMLSFLTAGTGDAFATEADQLIRLSIDKFRTVSDYTCRLDKQVNKNGRVYSDPDIFVKYKKPAHYYFRWDQGAFKGQEVIFVSGSNKDKVVAHPGGIFRFVTFHLDPDGYLAMKRNHHSLMESGMEKIMRIIESNYHRSKMTGLGMIQTRGKARVDGKEAWEIHGVFPKDHGFYAHEIIIYFDKKLQLPIKISVYDWSDRLKEQYFFRNLSINVGFTKSDFDLENPDYNF